VLECEDQQFLLALEEGDMGELEGVEVEAVKVGFAFAGTAVADPDIWDLGELGEDDVTVFLYFL
jgi:hypothetical protein